MPFRKRIQYQQFSSLPLLSAECAFQFDTFQVDAPDRAFQGCPQSFEFPPLAQPNPVRRFLSAALIASSGLIASPFTPTAEAITVDKWYQALSEPVRTHNFPTAQQQSIAFVATIPEIVTVDKWFEPYSEPVRLRRLATAQQQLATAPPIPQPPTLDGWWNPLNEPVRFKRLPIADYPAAILDPTTPAPRADTWLFPYSDPVRSRKLATAQQPGAVVAPKQPEGKEGWFAPLSDPVRVKRLPAALQPAAIIDPYPVTPAFTPDALWSALSEPVRLRRLPAAQQSTATFDPYPIVVVFEPQSIWGSWSEPVRPRRLATSQYQAFTGDLRPYQPLAIWGSWSEPVRVRKLPAAQRQSFTISPYPVAPFEAAAIWGALSEPARLKRLPTALRQSFTTDPYPVPTAVQIPAIWGSWSEPKRFRRGLRTDDQQTTTSNIYPVYPIGVDCGFQYEAFQNDLSGNPAHRSGFQVCFPLLPDWFQSFSEPKRFKRGLRPDLQQTTRSSQIIPPQPPLDWRYGYVDPVRVKPALRVGLHQTFARGFPPISFDLIGNELGDTFVGSIDVLDESPTGAIVSIKELVVPRLAILGTIEDQYQFGGGIIVGGVFYGGVFDAGVFDTTSGGGGTGYFEIRANITILEIRVPNLAALSTIEGQHQESSGVYFEIRANVSIIEIEP